MKKEGSVHSLYSIRRIISIIVLFAILPYNFGYWFRINPYSFNLSNLFLDYNLQTFFEMGYIFFLVWFPILLSAIIIAVVIYLIPVITAKKGSKRGNCHKYILFVSIVEILFIDVVVVLCFNARESFNFLMYLILYIFSLHMMFVSIWQYFKDRRTHIIFAVIGVDVMMSCIIGGYYYSGGVEVSVLKTGSAVLVILNILSLCITTNIIPNKVLSPYNRYLEKYKVDNGEEEISKDFVLKVRGVTIVILLLSFFILYFNNQWFFLGIEIEKTDDITKSIVMFANKLTPIFWFFTMIHSLYIYQDYIEQDKARHIAIYIWSVLFVIYYIGLFSLTGHAIATAKILSGQNFLHKNSNYIVGVKGFKNIIPLGTSGEQIFIVPMRSNNVDEYFPPCVYMCNGKTDLYRSFTFNDGIFKKIDAVCSKEKRKILEGIFFACDNNPEISNCRLRKAGVG